MSEHDLVVISTPLTKWTRGLVDAELLGSMPDGSVFVITGRGAIVETDARRERPADGRARAGLASIHRKWVSVRARRRERCPLSWDDGSSLRFRRRAERQYH